LNESLYSFLSIDAPAICTALFAAFSCALLGNFLLLRKLSLMGDSISHSVLPGIVTAFLLFSSRASFFVFIGAACAGVISAAVIELIKKLGRVEEGAAMGVVFSSFFALGVLLMEQAAARSVDLDSDCLLHGQLESIFWFPPSKWTEFFTLATFNEIPLILKSAVAVATFVLCFVVFCFKELTLSAFDSQLSDSLGFSSRQLHYALMIVVAISVVASFQAVGSILVIAMLICPAAVARMYTDKLKTQCIISVVVSFLGVTTGYAGAVLLPRLVNWPHALSSAGMITVMLGLFLVTSIISAPVYGLVARRARQKKLGVTVILEDIIANLYRLTEKGTAVVKENLLPGVANPRKELNEIFEIGGSAVTKALKLGRDKGFLIGKAKNVSLSDAGIKEARRLIRAHRLWESYLVEEAGLRDDHVHSPATKLEHFTEEKLLDDLADTQKHPMKDPQGKKIPE